MMLLFWVLAPCRLVGRCQRFGESSALKMETVCFSETLASTNESTRRQDPEDHHHHPHRRENLKSHNYLLVWHLVWKFLDKSILA
jgi:hypothetical protein